VSAGTLANKYIKLTGEKWTRKFYKYVKIFEELLVTCNGDEKFVEFLMEESFRQARDNGIKIYSPNYFFFKISQSQKKYRELSKEQRKPIQAIKDQEQSKYLADLVDLSELE